MESAREKIKTQPSSPKADHPSVRDTAKTLRKANAQAARRVQTPQLFLRALPEALPVRIRAALVAYRRLTSNQRVNIMKGLSWLSYIIEHHQIDWDMFYSRKAKVAAMAA